MIASPLWSNVDLIQFFVCYLSLTRLLGNKIVEIFSHV